MRRTPLGRSTPLQRAARLTRRAITASRPKVTTEERAARKIVAARSFGLCELGPRDRAVDMHHRKNRSQGGRWCPTNLIHLCRLHHHEITTRPNVAAQQGWTVLRHQDPARVPVWLYGRGYVHLTADGGIEQPEEEAA